MPELPEVETVRRGLQPVMEGTRIARVEARRGDLRFPLQKDFLSRLDGQTVTGLGPVSYTHLTLPTILRV